MTPNGSPKNHLTHRKAEKIKQKKKSAKQKENSRLQPKPIKVTLNVRGINIPIKRLIKAEENFKYLLNTCCLQENHLNYNDINRMKKLDHENIKSEVTLLITDKTGFRIKNCIREGHYTMIKK